MCTDHTHNAHWNQGWSRHGDMQTKGHGCPHSHKYIQTNAQKPLAGIPLGTFPAGGSGTTEASLAPTGWEPQGVEYNRAAMCPLTFLEFCLETFTYLQSHTYMHTSPTCPPTHTPSRKACLHGRCNFWDSICSVETQVWKEQKHRDEYCSQNKPVWYQHFLLEMQNSL